MSQVRELRISYRKENQKDFNFLVELYGTTREDVAKFGKHLSRKERTDFIESQFKAQSEDYSRKYKKAKYQIIQESDIDIGRLVTNSTKNSIHVVFFAILPKARSKSIGSSILRTLVESTHSEKKIVSIYVSKQNKQARALYDKLGFKIKKGGTDFYDYMETEI